MFEFVYPEYISFLFKAQNDTVDCLLDSIIINNKTKHWSKTVYYPDSTLTLTINTSSLTKHVFQKNDTVEYIGYSTIDTIKKIHKIWTTYLEDDTTLLFKMNMYDLPFTHWKRLSPFKNDSVEIYFSMDSLFVDRNGFVAEEEYREFFFGDGAYSYIYDGYFLSVINPPGGDPKKYIIRWINDDLFVMIYCGMIFPISTYIYNYGFKRL